MNSRPLDCSTDRGPPAGPLCRALQRPAESAQIARHSRHQRLGHTFIPVGGITPAGGDSNGGLTNQRQARAGLAPVQPGAVCLAGRGCGTLYVFQRTYSSVDVRNNQPTDPNWMNSQKAGWQDERRRNFGSIMTGPGGERFNGRLTKPFACCLAIFRSSASGVDWLYDVDVTPVSGPVSASIKNT